MPAPTLNDKNNELQFVMLSSLISLLLDKEIISEEEFEKSTSETGTAFKLFKHRNKLQEILDLGPDEVPLALVCIGKTSADPALIPRKDFAEKTTYIK